MTEIVGRLQAPLLASLVLTRGTVDHLISDEFEHTFGELVEKPPISPRIC
jgi:hypothetical protein